MASLACLSFLSKQSMLIFAFISLKVWQKYGIATSDQPARQAFSIMRSGFKREASEEQGAKSFLLLGGHKLVEQFLGQLRLSTDRHRRHGVSRLPHRERQSDAAAGFVPDRRQSSKKFKAFPLTALSLFLALVCFFLAVLLGEKSIFFSSCVNRIFSCLGSKSKIWCNRSFVCMCT